MALHSELPIYKVAYNLSDLAVDLVRNMPRDVKGVIGSELRDQRETVHYVARTASQAQATAERHQHNPQTGDVLVSPRQHGGLVGEGRGFDPLK